MSGIVGILNFDGAPVDTELLCRMTGAMAYRGPDLQQAWAGGNIGFGHALFRTDDESATERQPFTLDGKVWITSDARIDGRNDLIGKLRSRDDGPPIKAPLATVPDVELILRAYYAWGEGCLTHLIGDFAFAIWDDREHRLFCANDHFGIKPFYYAECGRSLVVGNTLDAIRVHPLVSDRLNDAAIADFLIFGFNQNPATTSFLQIRRLAPGHAVSWTAAGGPARVDRYWSLPVDGHIRYRHHREYLEHFQEVLERAVSDRMRSASVEIAMSGGLDSTSIAAVACGIRDRRHPITELSANTVVYDRLVPDQERRFAAAAAKALKLPIRFLVADDYDLFGGSDNLESIPSEPADLALRQLFTDHVRMGAAHSRVRLTGDGGDTVLRGPSSLFRGTPLTDLVMGIGHYARENGRLPSMGLRPMMRGMLHRRVGPVADAVLPSWLDGDFSRRLDISQWARRSDSSVGISSIHPVRAEAHAEFCSGVYAFLGLAEDPGSSRVSLEHRHPFLDLRVVTYLLALPNIPWFLGKAILRWLMKPFLPDLVRFRKKAVFGLVAPNLTAQLAHRSNFSFFSPLLQPTPELDVYVNRKELSAAYGLSRELTEADWWCACRVASLSIWLKSLKNRMITQKCSVSFIGVTHG